MPEQVGNPLDPFGQFLAQAFLSGRVPGNQTSAYNTVLDLLSPGAVTDRAEAGTIDPANLFFNQFGVVPQQDELLRIMQQQTGLTTTPAQELGEGTKRFVAEQETEGRRLYGSEAAKERAKGDVDVAKIQEKLAKAQGVWDKVLSLARAREADARAGKATAETGLIGEELRKSQEGILSPADRKSALDVMLTSQAAGHAGVNEQGEVFGTATPEQKAIATKVLKLDEKLLTVVGSLLDSGDNEIAFNVIDTFAPDTFVMADLEGPIWSFVSWALPWGKTGSEKVPTTLSGREPTGAPTRTPSQVFGLGGGQPTPVDPNRPQSNIGGPAMNETQLSNVLTNIDAMLAMGQIDPVQAEGMKQEIMDAYKSKGALQ